MGVSASTFFTVRFAASFLPIAEFDREAETLADAIASAVHSLDEAGAHIAALTDLLAA